MNADAEVARWIGDGAPLGRAASDALVEHIEGHWCARGFGLWAVEERAGGAFVGFAASRCRGSCPRSCRRWRSGWRLARGAWGRGYATEAGAAALTHAFQELALAEVVATVFPGNARSVRVAEKLGLRLTGYRLHPVARREIAIYRTSAPPVLQSAGNFSGN
jgi:RimJ/RimL family protein N-acetyltransferase